MFTTLSWRWLVTSSFVVLSLTGCNSVKSVAEIAKIARESVVLINYTDKPGQGTGFFVIGENKAVCTVLTVRHVVQPSAKLQLQTPDQKIWTHAEVKRFPNQDLAVVTFQPDSGSCPYPALQFGNSQKVNLGDSIYIIGFPGTGLTKQFVSGAVSLIENQTEGYGISYTAITAAGMSGSPVMNNSGKLVAVHGRTDVELTKLAEIKRETPPQQQSTGSANPSVGDAVGTFKWGIPINIYVANVAQIPTEAQQAKNFLNEGNDLSASQNNQEALVSYDKALELNSGLEEAWFGKGFALDELKRYPEAIASYDKALAIKPDKSEAWYNRGFALDELKRYPEAIASYDKALAIKPDAEAWYNRGIALYELKHYPEAIASYDKALAIKPDKSEAWYNRGIALDELKHYPEAIASYDKALTIKPDKSEAWYNRGIALYELKHYPEAIASYDKALAIKPDKSEAWYSRGFALGELKRYPEAIASYDKALAIKPDAEAWYNRGIALDELKHYPEAIASYDKALAIKPDKSDAWYSRGFALEQLKHYDEAVTSYDKAIKFNLNDQQAINNRKRLLKKLGLSQ